MLEKFHPVRLQNIDKVQYLVKPDQIRQPGSLDSDALDVMTDFESVRPVTIEDNTLLNDALEVMRQQHVRLLFALDSDGQVSGVITTADIMGDKPLVYAQNNGQSRDQLEVRQIMRRRDQIKALTYDQVSLSKVGDIMLTLKGSGEQHVLVLDESLAGVLRIRGIISTSDISKHLKISFDVMYEVKTFAEIEQVIVKGG